MKQYLSTREDILIIFDIFSKCSQAPVFSLNTQKISDSRREQPGPFFKEDTMLSNSKRSSEVKGEKCFFS